MGDCPILRPRAGLPLSRACDSPFAMSFGATHAPRDSPHPCGSLLAAACLRRDTSSALRASSFQAPFVLRACSRSWSHVAMLPNARMQLQPLFVSLARRMMATIINCVVEKTSAHSDDVLSMALSPDGTKIVSACRGGMIKVWDSGAPEPSNRPSLAKPDACWLVWQARWSC